MCFSAEADLVSGVIVGVVAIDAIRHAHRPSLLLLAALPGVFAAHQLVEAVVWLGLDGRLADAVVRPAAWVYLAIAFGVLPVLVPTAVRSIEPGSNPRINALVAATGIAAATVLMYSLVRGPVEATIEGHHIAYRVELWHGGLIVALYVIATCGALLVSSDRDVRRFGATNVVAVVLLAWLDQSAFISLWCTWAALTSLLIAMHLRKIAATPTPMLVHAS
jgi:hypothetical protein